MVRNMLKNKINVILHRKKDTMKTKYDLRTIPIKRIESLSSYFSIIENELANDKESNFVYYFRGELKIFKDTALQPSIYRKSNLVKEHIFFRELKRYNDDDFSTDTSTIDNLCRMQHYSLPTRLIDMSEDPLSALWFAVSESEKEFDKKCLKCDKDSVREDSCVYMIKVNKNNIKYYDSDTITAIANLSKLPLNEDYKSKQIILSRVQETLKILKSHNRKVVFFNSRKGVSYLHHEIWKDINHYEPIIFPEHIVSIQCIKPKLISNRIHNQKGAFLIFGLNYDDVNSSIPIIQNINAGLNLLKSKNAQNQNPIESITRIDISNAITSNLLGRIGVKMCNLYPEIEKVSEYFKDSDIF